jgi:hypothetical protein
MLPPLDTFPCFKIYEQLKVLVHLLVQLIDKPSEYLVSYARKCLRDSLLSLRRKRNLKSELKKQLTDKMK